MDIRTIVRRVLLVCALAVASPVTAHQYNWDAGCQCWIPDTSGPTIPDTSTGSTPPDPEPSVFELAQTNTDVDGYRVQSSVVTFDHHQPDGIVESRKFRYTTPSGYANRPDSSVNLWIIFHGGNGNTTTMHRYFKLIAAEAPTVIVYPQALRVTPYNEISSDPADTIMWRGVKTPDSGANPNAYRDITFVERLVGRLLVNNPQLNANKVYATGFSSGGLMTWSLLCFRSSLFAGFAIYSHQLGLLRETHGCGNGELQSGIERRTGYEILTGDRPDEYGRHLNGSRIIFSRTKPTLYIHGTEDDNLTYTGQPGCWQGRPPVTADECTLSEDPLYSMDYGGPLQQRDDISSVNWLLSRHLSNSTPSTTCTVLDADRSDSDNVSTRRYEYNSDTSSSIIVQGAPVTWYEMQGAGHDVSTLNQSAGVSNSTDFEAVLHTQKFFEEHAGMLPGIGSGVQTGSFFCMAAPRF